MIVKKETINSCTNSKCSNRKGTHTRVYGKENTPSKMDSRQGGWRNGTERHVVTMQELSGKRGVCGLAILHVPRPATSACSLVRSRAELSGPHSSIHATSRPSSSVPWRVEAPPTQGTPPRDPLGTRGLAGALLQETSGVRACASTRQFRAVSEGERKEFKQKNSLSQQTGSTQVRTGAC